MRNMKKILSFLLVLSMVLSYVPMPTLAAEGDPCTVTEGCEGTYNAEGICTVCNLAQLVVTEGAEECQHSGGTATCTALAVCEKCNEPYGELAAHTGGEATCKAQAVCTVCTAAYGELAAHSYENGVCAGCGAVCTHAEYAEGKCTVCGAAEPHAHTYTDGVCGCGEICNHAEYAEGKCTVCGAAEPCVHSGGTATCKDQAICEKCETAYGELAAHNYGTDADGKCDACGADCSHSYADGVCGTCGFACVHESYSEGKCAVCSAVCPHAEYLDGKCKVCGMDEPVPEPVVLTITAWSWVDEYEILSEDGTYATLPNAADWETLKSVLPAYITAIVDGAEVEIPVQWECETFPTEGEGQGTYELKAILPEGYALGESVSTLKLEVDLGVADQLADGTTWDGTTVATAYAGGNGTETDPYIIATAGQLIYLRNKVNSGTSYNGEYFRLDADLDMAGKTFGNAIGTSYFNGHFDGNGHTISNLTIGNNSNGYSALFGNVGFNGQEVVIKNLTLVNVNVNRTDKNYGAAALVGQPRYAKIENCTVESGTVTSKAYYAGGLVASLNTSGTYGLTIIDCVNRADVTNNSTDSQPFTGGILAKGAGATITGCTNYGTITTNKYYAGGIAGSSHRATIEKCANYGAVSSTNGYASGILADGRNEVVKNCYNQGNITAKEYATGITGLFGSTSGHTDKDTIINCYSVGTISGAKKIHAISIKGNYPNNCTLENNYSLTAGDAYVTQKTEEEFADGTVYKLLAKNNPGVWGQTIGTDSYPVFFNGNNIPVIKDKVTITATAVNGEYNGSAHAGYTDVNAGTYNTTALVVTYTGRDGTTHADSTTAPTNAGKYTVTIAIPSTDETYTGSVSVDFEITAKEIGITWSHTELTYNGQVQAPTATATELIDGDTCTITVTGGQTNIGTNYTAEATEVSNTNYKLPGDGVTTAFAIKAAEVTDVTLAANSTEVTGSAQIPTISTVKAGELTLADTDYTVSYKDSAGQPVTEMKNVGTYKVVVTANNGSNFSGSKEVEWKITKKQPTITTVPTVAAITYGQTLADATLAGGVASEDGTFAFKEPTTAPTVTDSNSTEYTLVFTPTDTENYDSVEIKVKVAVNPKEIGITWGTTEFIYDGEAKLPTASVAEGSAINGDQLGLTVALVETTEGAGTNAGTYTAKVTGITGDKAANYKLPTNITTSFVIKNASQSKPENLTGNQETILNKADGTITGLTTDMEWSKEENGTYTAVSDVNMTFAAGTYYVRYKAKANHDASPATTVTIAAGDPLTITVPGEQTAYSLTADKTAAGWHDNVTITFALKPGYSVGEDFAVKVNDQKIELDNDGKYIIQNVEAAVTVTVTGIADTNPPSVKVTLEDNWNTLWNGITFGKFFKETKTFTITAADQETGISKVYYHLAEEELTKEDVETADLSWTEYDLNGNGVSVDPDKVFIIYAKAVDNAGNITFVNSNGIVLDKTVPVISGVTNRGVYYTTQKVTATDSAISGTSTLQSLTGTNADGTVPGDPAQETKHTIVATDKAGNTTTFEITMKPISSLATGLPTEDTVKMTDKETIETIKKNVSDVLTNQSANATDAEKDKLEDIIAQCNDLLNQIKKAEDVITLIQALPEASKAEPDNKKHIDAYDAALAAYNDPNLSASSKRMVGEENKAKLDAVGKALVAYDITHQSSKYYVKGSGKTLTFTANGYYAEYGSYVANAYGKFVSIEVDGKVVDAKSYTAKAGSTVISLKSSYLESLSTGKHTIKVNYIDGSTDGNDTFRISVNNGNPFTGDNSHMMLFGGMAMTSLLCMAMMAMFISQKKGKYER